MEEKFHPDHYKTPGQLISSLLDYRGWSSRALSIILGMDETGINKIISGKRQLKAELAITLGDVFDIPADTFLELQKRYDLAQAQIVSRPDPARADRAILFGDLPISAMIKRGWIDAKSLRDKDKIELGLTKFFNVKKLKEIELLPHAAKRTEISTKATPAQLAWLYRVNVIASEMLVAKYTSNSIKNILQKLRPLLSSAEEIRKIPRILAENGIRFVIVESLPSAKIDGVCFWLDDNSPVIGMSLRYDRIDNFWFVLRHELEHVNCGHGKAENTIMLDTELEGENAGTGETVEDEEVIANQAAADFCVPQKKLEGFIAKKSPFFSERDIIGFSRTEGIHAGLLAGQIQRHTGRYNIFRAHLVKIRSKIIPSAVVDGWGDVYPVDDY